MQVIATAGHVDHGKSALVRALTGMEPDRWAEERRRGMTIDLGFAWTTLPSGEQVAFVDVPGHERFVGNMLAGVGPVPAALFVVAADEGWKPQSEEHLQALDALGVEHALLVVTKTDLAPPGPVVDASLARLATTALRRAAAVAVSTRSGAGLDDLVAALDRLVVGLPGGDPDAPVRIWVDRSFTVRGAGTVVTGTLAGGRVAVGDAFEAVPSGAVVTVRGIESCKSRREAVEPVARVALNLRGVAPADLPRGTALVTPRSWWVTDEVDVLLSTPVQPHDVVAHIGSASVPVRIRSLEGRAARLRLAASLPLHVGDRLLLRDPARHVVVARADVADVAVHRLHRRGDAARVAATLGVPATADGVVRRHGVVRASDLLAWGVSDQPGAAVAAGGWWVDAPRWATWRDRLPAVVAAGADPLSPGVAVEAVQRTLGLPDVDVARALVAAVDGVTMSAGRVRPAAQPAPDAPGLDLLLKRLADDPFDAPEAADLVAAGLDRAVLAHGVRTGAVLHLGNGVYVGAEAPAVALERLAGLEQPFTVSSARVALTSTRRVVVPLLEHLDAARRTRKQPDGTRFVVGPPG